MKLVFYYTHGARDQALQELKNAGVMPYITTEKYVLGEYSYSLRSLEKLKLIDDVGIHIKSFTKRFIHINDIKEILSEINHQAIFKTISEIRKTAQTFSITVSRFKDQIHIEDIKGVLATLIEQNSKLTYTPRDHSNYDIRINVTEENLMISIKLFTHSLYKRSYIHRNYMGSIKPTIAALMLSYINKAPQSHKFILLDPFCGSGTILCEADNNLYELNGSDKNENAIEITKERLKYLNINKYKLKVAEISNTSWANQSVDVICTNPPWDEQLKLGDTEDFWRKTVKEFKRIIKLQGKIIVLTKQPQLLITMMKESFGKIGIQTQQVKFNGQNPTIVIFDL